MYNATCRIWVVKGLYDFIWELWKLYDKLEGRGRIACLECKLSSRAASLSTQEEYSKQVEAERLEKERIHTEILVGIPTLEELMKELYFDHDKHWPRYTQKLETGIMKAYPIESQ